jgi:hypothetical protein
MGLFNMELCDWLIFSLAFSRAEIMCVPMLILWSKKTHNLPFGKKLESGAVGMYLVGSSTDGIPPQTPT